MSRKRTGPTQKVRDLVHGRDRGCVACGETYLLQVHHRRPRGAGGTRREDSNQPANLILLCLSCHAWTESQRETALDRGLLVPQNQTPAAVPLLRHGEWSYLTDDGDVLPCHPCGHRERVAGCGGCDPGAIAFVIDDTGRVTNYPEDAA